ERRRARRCLGAPGTCVLLRGRIGLEAAPCHRTRETEAVEIGGVVARDARRQHLSLPGARRQLEPLELADHLEEPVAAVELRPRLHVLPAEEEAHQVGGGDGLDLPAQATEGQAVDAGEEAPLAPLLLARVGREPAAQRDAGALEPGETDRDGARREADARGEPLRRRRADALEPAAEERMQGLLAAG